MTTQRAFIVRRLAICVALLAVLWNVAAVRVARACPFCSAASQTLSEELAAAEVAVIARLVKGVAPPAATSNDPVGLDAAIDPDSGKATFEIVEVLRGAKLVDGVKQIKVVYFGENEQNKKFMISGVSGQPVDWTTPLPLAARAVEYVKQLGTLPEKGVDRLTFFMQHFEDEDPLLAQDAYDEFARAPYSEILAMADHMDRQRLTGWINNPEVGPTRRRLYLTLLGVCGQEGDIAMLESLLRYDYQQLKPGIATMVAKAGLHGSVAGVTMVDELVRADVRRKRQCLDALIAAYLKLKGPAGMPLVEQMFLTNPAAEYTHVYATIMALRFHGEESDDIPKERLKEALRLVLENEEIADQVIPDLARWEDWTILGRLVSMFKGSEKDAWIRQPVISYLLVAEEQPGDVGTQAKSALAELEELDPQGVKRARSYAAFGLLARAGAKKKDKQEENTGEKTEETVAAKTEPAAEQVADKPAADAVESKNPETEKAAEPVVETAKTAEVEEPKVAATEAKPDATETAAREPSDVVEEAGPSRTMIIGVPLASVVLLMGVFALLLRGSDIREPAERS